MKQICRLILIVMIVFCSGVYADGVWFKYRLDKDQYVLEVFDEHNNIIDYDTAIKEYNIDEYIEASGDHDLRYFYKGKEISKSEYDVGKPAAKANAYAKTYGDFGIRVSNTDEVIKAIDFVYTIEAKSGEYHLVYSTEEYKNINFQEIEKYMREKYMSDIRKNVYTFAEYGIYHPFKFMPIYNEFEMTINNLVKTTTDEQAKVDEFLKIFLPLFDGKSDYEKILSVYTYLQKTVKYETDNGYTIFTDALLSPYDILLKQKGVCIGLATTFSYLMDKLDIDSRIVDVVLKIDEKNNSYNTIHTYNAVKLDDKWYIIDVNNSKDFDIFLIGKDSSKYNRADFSNSDIVINGKSYVGEFNPSLDSIAFDYDTLNKKIANILDTKEEVVKDSPKEVAKDDEFLAYLVLSLILIIIFLIVVFFTIKLRK